MCPTPISLKSFTGIKDTQVMKYLVFEISWGLEQGLVMRAKTSPVCQGGTSRDWSGLWCNMLDGEYEVWRTKPCSLVPRLAAHWLRSHLSVLWTWPTRSQRAALEPSPVANERVFSVCSVLLTMLCD